MKLNIGCGFNKLQGYLNCDSQATCSPDQIVDFENSPWPWESNFFDDVMAYHSLEHMGATTEGWLSIMKELWRVCKPDAIIRIAVPHHRHDNFSHDPTHVRLITPIGLAMFDQMRNLRDAESGGQETKLGLYTGIDFEILEVHHDLDEPWLRRQKAGEITNEQLNLQMRTLNNVCIQYRIVLRAVKPGRAGQA